MPYSGQLNTIQKEMPQLLLLDSSTSSSLLPESFLLFPAFDFLFSTIAVMHEKKNMQYAHCPLKAFPSFFSETTYFLCLRFQCILPSQRTYYIVIYNSILCPTKQKEKGKRLHYLQCGNSLLNHGNISMFNRT